METGAFFNLEALVLLIIFAPWIIKAIRRLFGGFKNMIRNARKSSKGKSADQMEAEARANGTFIRREGNTVYTRASPEFEEKMHKLGQYLVEQERAKKAQEAASESTAASAATAKTQAQAAETQKANADPSPYVYRKQYDLMTKREKTFFDRLLPAAQERGYKVCPKVRLADIFFVPQGPDFWERFKPLSQKHVDFLLLDEYDDMFAAIELDDASHESEKGKENDAFKDRLFSTSGFQLFRIAEVPERKVMGRYLDYFITVTKWSKQKEKAPIPAFTGKPGELDNIISAEEYIQIKEKGA